MVGNAVTAALGTQLGYDRSPESLPLPPSDWRGNCVNGSLPLPPSDWRENSVNGSLPQLGEVRGGFYFFLILFFFIGLGFLVRTVRGWRLACLLQFHLRGRHAALVVAGTVLQVAVNGVFGLGELDFLHKGGSVLEVLQLHAEHVVELLDDVAAWGELAHRFHALHFDGIERGLDGAVAAQVGGIDVPAGGDGGREYDFCLGTAAGLQLRREVNGVDHLCMHSEGCQQQ